jgi:hypothetical protein
VTCNHRSSHHESDRSCPALSSNSCRCIAACSNFLYSGAKHVFVLTTLIPSNIAASCCRHALLMAINGLHYDAMLLQFICNTAPSCKRTTDLHAAVRSLQTLLRCTVGYTALQAVATAFGTVYTAAASLASAYLTDKFSQQVYNTNCIQSFLDSLHSCNACIAVHR